MAKPRIPSPLYESIRRQARREGEDLGARIAAAAQKRDAEDREQRVRVEVGEAALRAMADEYRRGQREGIEAGKGMGYFDGYDAGYAAAMKGTPFPWLALAWGALAGLIVGCIVLAVFA